MFSYYGSKSKIVGCYPTPKFGKIIEPFAGSARYSLKYFDRDILLVDKYEVIVRIWKWLQEASERDIMSLPEPKLKETIDRKDFDCIEQAWLMGFLVQQGVNAPRLTVSKYAENGIRTQKKNIAQQLYKIKHWEIRLDDYENIKNESATWFIDPPYQFGGEYYVKSNKEINYERLADWCKRREGQTIVCENSKASWLPFRQMAKLTGSKHTTTEVIWSNQQTEYDWETIPMFEESDGNITKKI
jgi:site-specific DNA-adenine methylase